MVVYLVVFLVLIKEVLTHAGMAAPLRCLLLQYWWILVAVGTDPSELCVTVCGKVDTAKAHMGPGVVLPAALLFGKQNNQS